MYLLTICSTFSAITCWVPQGSMLGPLLFIIYINGIVVVSCKLSFVLYADNISLFASHKKLG